jgi:hypothetical protein
MIPLELYDGMRLMKGSITQAISTAKARSEGGDT